MVTQSWEIKILHCNEELVEGGKLSPLTLSSAFAVPRAKNPLTGFLPKIPLRLYMWDPLNIMQVHCCQGRGNLTDLFWGEGETHKVIITFHSRKERMLRI